MKDVTNEIKNNQPELIYGVGLCEYIDLEKAVESLDDAVTNMSRNFVIIGQRLKELKEHAKFFELGFESIYELTEVKYGFSKTSTKNFISVYERFGDKNEYTSINSKYRNYNFSQLVELIPEQENLDNYSPLQTVKEMRLTKLSKNVESDKTKIYDWFKDELFPALSKKYKDCKLRISNSNCINIKYKKKELTIYIKSDFLVRTYCWDIRGFKDKETILSYKLISMEIDRFIKAVDTELAEGEANRKVITTTTTVTKEIVSSPISDHQTEEDDEYDPTVDEEINKEVPEVVEVEVIDVPIKKQLLKNNKQREEFIKDENNYTLLYDLEKVNARIYQHKEISYIYEIKYYGKFYGNENCEWKHASYHMMKPETSKTFGYCMFSYSECAISVIVEHLKDIKY